MTWCTRRAWVRLSIALGVVFAGLAFPLGAAQAAGTTFVVTSTADSGAGSLREAIAAAELTADDDTITFDGSVFTAGSLHTITLASTLPTITKPLTILGPGQDVLAISGDDTVRVMSVNGDRPNRWTPYPYPQGLPVTITDLTLTRGRPPMEDANPYVKLGGALSLSMAKLTMERVTVSRSTAWLGGGIAVTHSSLTMTNSLVEDNTATGEGGGIYSDWADLGEQYAYLDIHSSIFRGNSAPGGGAISGRRTTWIDGSTFTGNTSTGKGGALRLGYNFDHRVTNSVISGNSAVSGGGIAAGTAGYYKSRVTVSGSTVSGNVATSGDGSGGLWIGSSIMRVLNSTFDNGASGDCGWTWEVTPGGSLMYANLTDTSGSTFSDNSCHQFDRAGLMTAWTSASAGGTSILSSVGDPPFLVGDKISFCGPNNCNTSGVRTGVVSDVSATDDTLAVVVDATVSAASYAINLYGAAWVNLPKIRSLDPATGDPSGGDAVTITGAGFGSASATPTPAIAVTFDGVAATSITHIDDTTLIVTTPPGTVATATVEVSGNANTAAGAANSLVNSFTYNGIAPSPSPSPSPTPSPEPTPARTASQPLDVLAIPGDRSALVSWQAPSTSGSFAITHYQAVSTPSGGSCLSETLTCEINGLASGSTYSFTVRALTGAGWGPWSESSAEITPEELTDGPSIVIAGTRSTARGRALVSISGRAYELGDADAVRVMFRFPGHARYRPGGMATLDGTGAFAWSRRTGRTLYVYVSTVDGDVRSNRVVVSAR